MKVRSGFENLLGKHSDLIADRRIGLVSNAAALASDLRPVAQWLQEMPGVEVAALFGPEHGFDAAVPAGISVADGGQAALPIYSLYGDTQQPSDKMLDGLDCLVFDIQMAGVRFYTYLSTLLHVMQAAAEHDLPLIVCDRPNPIGGKVLEGPVLDPAFASFVGCGPLPIRHGLTAGEAALYFSDFWAVGCQLSVIPCLGWQRPMWFDETGMIWAPPSPNMPHLSTVMLYSGTCLFEGTNFSEGRGTSLPFEMIGAPWLDGRALADQVNALNLPGLKCRPVQFAPPGQ